jgi:hypothetical protein
MPTHFKRICLAIDELPPYLDFEVFKLQFLEGSNQVRELNFSAISDKQQYDFTYMPFTTPNEVTAPSTPRLDDRMDLCPLDRARRYDEDAIRSRASNSP